MIDRPAVVMTIVAMLTYGLLLKSDAPFWTLAVGPIGMAVLTLWLLSDPGEIQAAQAPPAEATPAQIAVLQATPEPSTPAYEEAVRELVRRLIQTEYEAVAFDDSSDFALVDTAQQFGLPLEWICEQVFIPDDDDPDWPPEWTWSEGRDALEVLVSNERRAVVDEMLEKHGGVAGLHEHLWQTHARRPRSWWQDDEEESTDAFGTIPPTVADDDYGSPALTMANVEQIRGYEWVADGLPRVADF